MNRKKTTLLIKLSMILEVFVSEIRMTLSCTEYVAFVVDCTVGGVEVKIYRTASANRINYDSG